MNSVKNAIVTMTLLAVGYGAYVVLSTPAPEDFDAVAGDDWNTPSVSIPGESEISVEIPDASQDTATALVENVQGQAAAEFAPPPLDPSEYAQAETPLNGGDFGSPAVAPEPTYESTDGYGASDRYASDSLVADGGDYPSGQDSYDAPPSANFPPGGSDDPNALENQDAGEGGSYYTRAAAADRESYDGSEPSYPATSAPDFPFPGAMTPPANYASDDESLAVDTGAIPVDPSNNDSGFETSWQSVQADLAGGQYGNALMTLSAWYGAPSLTTEQRERCQGTLDQLAGTVIYSRESFLEPAHVVGPRETLDEIAKKYQVSAEFLARLNGIEAPYELYAGESLKVLQGPFHAEVNRSSGELTLFLGGHYAGRFPVRIGKELPIGENEFEVATVVPGREFFDQRSGVRVGPDRPENPYGNRWIGLRGDKITAAHHVGIHVDTGHPDRCCLGVSQVDAEDLAAILTIGARVTVTD